MSGAPSKTKTWVVLVTLLGLSAVMAYLFTPAGEATWGEPETADEGPAPHSGASGGGGSTIGPSSALSEGAVSPDPGAESRRDPIPLVGDAGAARRRSAAGQSNAGPGNAEQGNTGPGNTAIGGTQIGEAAPPAEQAPREPAPLPVQLEEMTPEREHHRAVIFRDVLTRRLEDTRAAAAAARAEGNPNRAARLERQAERLAQELPRVDDVEQARTGEPETDAPDTDAPDWWSEEMATPARQW
ncbi:MAG: hypothetical protein AB8I08_03835 [Sandaracinaceae bacterium]